MDQGRLDAFDGQRKQRQLPAAPRRHRGREWGRRCSDGGQGANQRHDPQNHRNGRGDESRRDIGRIHERASVGDGRHVDEMEIPQDKNLEVDIPESHNNGDRRMIRRGVSDPKIKTKCSNQLLDEEELFVKATKDFTVQQSQREEAAVGRETSVGGRI